MLTALAVVSKMFLDPTTVAPVTTATELKLFLIPRTTPSTDCLCDLTTLRERGLLANKSAIQHGDFHKGGGRDSKCKGKRLVCFFLVELRGLVNQTSIFMTVRISTTIYRAGNIGRERRAALPLQMHGLNFKIYR